MLVNVWIAVSDAAQSAIVDAINTPADEYTGPLTPRQRRLFLYMQNRTTRQALYKRAQLAGRTYNLWSVDFDDEKEDLQLVRQELDNLVADNPNQIAIVGAWKRDGRQVGASYDQDGNRTSEALYPIPNWLWRFMPDDADGNPTASSNADLRDVNILFGQSPRDFS